MAATQLGLNALVRVVAWNCCQKFETNQLHLTDLDPDVAVVSESSSLTHWQPADQRRAVTYAHRRVWPARPRELLVLARDPWQLTVHEEAASAPACALPVRITGPTSFVLVGLWTVTFPSSESYVRQMDQAVDWIENHVNGESVVLAGDFNAPIASTQAAYDRVVHRLERIGLVDAYRASRQLSYGAPPPEHTYFQHRRQERGFHIDHVILPAVWTDGMTIVIGDHDTWIESGRSDHAPVIVDIGGQH